MNLLPRDMTGRDAGALDLHPAPHLRTGAGAHGWRRQMMGMALGWPYVDTATLFILRRVFFKVSRMWAAAHVAGGSPEAFCAAVPMEARLADKRHLTAALARFEEARARATAVEAAWEVAFFGEAATFAAQLAALEATRLDARAALNGTRALFARYLWRDIARVRLATQTPAEVDAIYGAALNDFRPFVAPPSPLPPVAVSRAIPGTVGRDTWIRFKSPSARLGDVVTARVHEPPGVANPPTIILGHGICIEFDHWRGLVDETDELVRRGFRVIRPEAAWHGRRTRTGFYGGEEIVASFPMGSLDAFTGALQEWAIIADWAKRTSSGPLTMGGTSLGAQMAQLAATHARDWPERLRPQALLLITHCGSLADAVLHGAIPAIFGSAADIAAKGWTPERVAPYMALLDPLRTPPIPAERIVSVLGRRDVITPFTSGEPLVRDWGLPAENEFILDRGHFSVPMTLVRNTAAIDRFAAIVRGLAAG